ncbi:MAG TPA: hypothetical protein VMV69_09255 [Pirellulales bacterium]|nr:hypothetical protein [Pirellulales bacterium]
MSKRDAPITDAVREAIDTAGMTRRERLERAGINPHCYGVEVAVVREEDLGMTRGPAMGG